VSALVGAVAKRMRDHVSLFRAASGQQPNLLFDGLPIHLPLDENPVVKLPKRRLQPAPENSLAVSALDRQCVFRLRSSSDLDSYQAAESDEQPGRQLFYRPKDKQLAVPVPSTGMDGILIDQYATTNAQLCACLNDLAKKNLVWNERRIGLKNEPIWYCLGPDGALAADAAGFWRANADSKNPPWYCTGTPWGISYDQSTGWSPLQGSQLLPATLVTWHGADVYGRWAHDNWDAVPGSFLPYENEWMNAARSATRGAVNVSLNYAERLAGCELLTLQDVQRDWENRPSVYTLARPLPVADLAEFASLCGGVQFLGNVWEWCQDRRDRQKHVLKGGCCHSPREHCSIEYREIAKAGVLNPYVGFRCRFHGGKEA
jgi:formylglycine-generating enzyme required for sulfatase activity